MPAKYFEVVKKADKSFLKLPRGTQSRIIEVYKKLRENPLAGEKLRGELGDYYKFRVGDYRIVYIFDSKRSLVVVLKVEHRQGVYR